MNSSEPADAARTEEKLWKLRHSLQSCLVWLLTFATLGEVHGFLIANFGNQDGSYGPPWLVAIGSVPALVGVVLSHKFVQWRVQKLIQGTPEQREGSHRGQAVEAAA